MKRNIILLILILETLLISSEIPNGFNEILTKLGVKVYKKDYSGGKPDYVQVLSLSKGAKVKFLFGDKSDEVQSNGIYGGDNYKFKRVNIEDMWNQFKSNNSLATCVTNGQYFMSYHNYTNLSFPVLSDKYKIDGSDNGLKKSKMVLELFDTYATIQKLSSRIDSLDYLSSNAIVGLSTSISINSTTRIGRTMIGVLDEDNDGYNEKVIIFNSSYANSNEAISVLKSFGVLSTNIMQLDGGPSSQLVCDSSKLIKTSQIIPQGIGIISAEIDYDTSDNKPIITGVGSIINPETTVAEKYRFGSDRDEAIMQDHENSPSAVLFQWNYRKNVESCQYLNIVARNYDYNGKLDSNSNNNLDVSVYTKAWNSNTNNSSYNMTLPITIEKVDNWNTILISSREPLKDKLNIKAICSSSKTYKSTTATNINQPKVESHGKYVWAGNSSIIRRDNSTLNTQEDGIYRDVAISSRVDKGLTYFQWQPASNCLSLKLKAGQYPENSDGERVEVNGINMKSWASTWNSKNETNYCNGNLPCTIQAPNGANGYYIIKVKTNANAISSNRITAVCE
jgi:hypothetical protein